MPAIRLPPREPAHGADCTAPMSRTRYPTQFLIGGACGLMAMIFMSQLQAHAQASDAKAGRGVLLRYLNAPPAGADLRAPPHLVLSFGGRQRRAVMDTGSTGIVVSATAIPGIDQLPNLGPGTLTYTSSGRIMQGNWVMTPATITGADGTSITTTPVPVLAVRTISCTATARTCTPRDNPRGVAMIGVGFARKRAPEGGPDKNPFLNVPGTGPDGPRRGYVVTREGVRIGVTDSDMRDDYVTVRLRRDQEGTDWSAAPVCVVINDQTPAACGTVLPDTGLTRMFLALPPDQADKSAIPASGTDRTLPPGTKVTISLAPGAPARDGTAQYSFMVGDAANPLAPSRVILVGRGDRPTFVNTGVHLLNGFDYLYDADRGIVGYRRTGTAPR
jgi:hypothetical protein